MMFKCLELVFKLLFSVKFSIFSRFRRELTDLSVSLEENEC